MKHSTERTAQQRAIEVYDQILNGPKTAKEIAENLGIGLRGLYYILDNISLTRPLTNSGGRWYMLTTDEQREVHALLVHLERELAVVPEGTAFVTPLKRVDILRLVKILRRVVIVPGNE